MKMSLTTDDGEVIAIYPIIIDRDNWRTDSIYVDTSRPPYSVDFYDVIRDILNQIENGVE